MIVYVGLVILRCFKNLRSSSNLQKTAEEELRVAQDNIKKVFIAAKQMHT